MNNSILIKLFNSAQLDLKQNGFIGLDYNMAVICIISKRINLPVKFQRGNSTLSYHQKLDYWASKRNFAHLQVASDDELLQHAMKEYKIN